LPDWCTEPEGPAGLRGFRGLCGAAGPRRRPPGVRLRLL